MYWRLEESKRWLELEHVECRGIQCRPPKLLVVHHFGSPRLNYGNYDVIVFLWISISLGLIEYVLSTCFFVCWLLTQVDVYLVLQEKVTDLSTMIPRYFMHDVLPLIITGMGVCSVLYHLFYHRQICCQLNSMFLVCCCQFISLTFFLCGRIKTTYNMMDQWWKCWRWWLTWCLPCSPS